ncbi:MAG: putative hybrid sensor histidine kinase [Puniceicoccaceae bacterium 5H]|nr:MAG: putative hybrid sensor histidine kinase [Puniceicoccaceae bacterium 5H]
MSPLRNFSSPDFGSAKELLSLARVPVFRYRPDEEKWLFDAQAMAVVGGRPTMTTAEWVEHCPEDERPGFLHWLAYAREEHPGALVERTCCYREQGVEKWILLRARMQRDGSILGVFHDQTIERQRDRELQETEARLDALLDVLPVSTVLVSHDMSVLRHNRAAEEIWGVSLLKGNGAVDFARMRGRFADSGQPVHPDQWALARALSEERSVINDLIEIEAKGGEERVILNCAAPVRAPAGDIVGGVSVEVDVTERIRSLEALRSREAMMRMAHELARIGSFIWDIVEDDNQWSPELEQLYGFEPGTFPGTFKDWEVCLHPDDREAGKAAIEEAVRHGETEAEWRVMLPDGGERWLAARLFVLYDDDQRPIRMVGINIDVTERKLAEEAMRTSEERYRQLADAMPQLVWGADASGRVHYYNVRAKEYDGLTRDETAEWSWAPVLHPDDSEPTFSAWNNALRRRTVYQYEHRIRMRDGSYRWHLSRALPKLDQETSEVTWYGTATDIQDLRETQDALHGFFDGNEVYLAVLELRDDDFVFVRVNQHIADYHNCSIEKINGSTSREVGLPDAVRQRWVDILHECVERDEPLTFEYDLKRLDRINWLQCTLNRLPERGGDAVRFALTAVDITALKETEGDLRRKSEEADRANRAKSEFLAHMSHEIRSPMTAILGYAELLTQMVEGETEQEFLQTIQTEGEHLVQVINDILDLSRIEAGRVELHMRTTSPHEIVEGVLTLMNPAAIEKGLDLRLEEPETLPFNLHTDPTRLRQILVNLVSNAIKFTEEGEVVMRLRLDAVRHQLCFEIVDTGIGITEEQQKRLFQPFSQGDASVTRKYGGTGLGLVISRRLASLLGAEMQLRSEPGEGSVFTVCVPLPVDLVGKSREPRAVEGVGDETGPSLKGIEVLLVDDRRETRELVHRLLQRAAASVRLATNGEEAVTAATDQAPDIVVMDMQMPVMDGYLATQKLRERGFKRPVVALTAHAMQGEREKCLAAGCDEHLSKPIDARRLIRVLAQLGRRD